MKIHQDKGFRCRVSISVQSKPIFETSVKPVLQTGFQLSGHDYENTKPWPAMFRAVGFDDKFPARQASYKPMVQIISPHS
jgi:hypothetical protein